MAGSLNEANLIGNLCRDPEIRTTQDGKRIANLSIATNESYKNAKGELVKETQWHNQVAEAPNCTLATERCLQ